MNCPCNAHAEENVKALSNRWTSLDGLVKDIITYYEARGYKWPKNYWEAMGWFDTERGEATELYLVKDQDEWVRNNPTEQPKFTAEKFGEEIGDFIMMGIVAGIVEGVDSITALREKMKRKLELLDTKK